MAEYLVIRITDDREQAAQWIAVDGNGTRLGAPVTGPLNEAVRDLRGRNVVVLVPGADVLTTSADVPVRSGSRLLAALPYALEEHIADDVEDLHFAAGNRREGGRIPVAAVSHANMQAWIERLDEAGIKPLSIVPETYGLARIPGTLSLLAAEGQVFFNDGADSEFVMQGVKPSDALAIAGLLDDSGAAAEGEIHEPSPAHLLVYCEPADEQRFEHDWMALRHELSSVDINLLPDGILPRLAVTVAAGRGINLLQGRYAAKTEYSTALRPWKYAAMLLLALGVVLFGGKVADVWRLTQEETVLQARFTEEYRQVRPGDTRDIVDPVATVNSLKRSLGGPAADTVFLPTLRQLGLALQENQEAAIETITYRSGVVDVRLSAPDVTTLDNIQRSVSTTGRFTAEIKSTDQVGDRISSRIQILEPGA